ncbi:alpha-D-ribose 1-methylphosphonate 5-triphosphate diphosphatase [Dinghuibacter silviterrae]|uniref:Alpha-D-ribose 1-methylphosphonate 5-triphosphate diphosphatase n=1 Tax=Dinghuibacter silviterrae TaxID=1539049 RepID=A0A4R8DSK4_9BACT|nr:alpha-D-ribose 1-methylphosphonate 5-triphosphate diphosphatase [Dinghuibacter silviterrae]TDX00838.1 alpha-D-ribose 1-methylphosphonate 5-triphosphate diphosphatase [Dinghuibacter silviterrae]
MNNWLITHAQIVTPEGVIPDGFVRIWGGVIAEIGAMEAFRHAGAAGPAAGAPGDPAATNGLADTTAVGAVGAPAEWHAHGAILMPGIIDIHTDAMDLEIVPRPGADIPVVVAFRELERKMAACGITTVLHSMHLGYEVAEKQSRSGFSRATVFREVIRAAAGPTLLNNKIHLRFELSGVEAYDDCLTLLDEGSISLLSVMDHTPGQGQFSKKHFREAMLSQGKTEAQLEEEFRERTERPRIEGERLAAMIGRAVDRGIPVASHDDDSPEKVDAMVALGVTISEFPINMETARHATRKGLHVAGGASNILRGGSLSGNLNMAEAVQEKAVAILCSDYYPASILHSVFLLHHRRGMPLHEAVNLATLHPARAVRLERETGSVAVGKRADLLLVRLQEQIPMVTHTMVGGTVVLATAYKQNGDE